MMMSIRKPLCRADGVGSWMFALSSFFVLWLVLSCLTIIDNKLVCTMCMYRPASWHYFQPYPSAMNQDIATRIKSSQMTLDISEVPWSTWCNDGANSCSEKHLITWKLKQKVVLPWVWVCQKMLWRKKACMNHLHIQYISRRALLTAHDILTMD